MTGPVDPLEAWHRRARSAKEASGPKPVRCSNPLCATGWAALPDGPYCADCHMRIEERAELLRARHQRRKSAA